MRSASFGLSLALLGCTADTLGLGSDAGSPLDLGALELGVFDLGRPDLGRADLGALDSGAFDSGVPAGSDYWSLEPKMASISTRAFMNAGATAFIEVEIYPDHVCELAGPIEVLTEANVYQVRAWAWVHHIFAPGEGDCQFVTDRVVRDVPVELGVGTHGFVEPVSGQSMVIEITPAVSCGQTMEGCNGDCDCPQSDCVPCAGDLECVGQCGQACNPVEVGCCSQTRPDRDLECPPEARCESAFTGTGYASGRCVSRTEDPCVSDDECPPGMFCPLTGVPRGCMWSVELSAASRHACEGSQDCDPGLLCVENRSSGRRACEVPCFSARSRCPRAHFCSPEAWVCEWIGD